MDDQPQKKAPDACDLAEDAENPERVGAQQVVRPHKDTLVDQSSTAEFTLTGAANAGEPTLAEIKGELASLSQKLDNQQDKGKEFRKNLGWLMAELFAGLGIGEAVGWIKSRNQRQVPPVPESPAEGTLSPPDPDLEQVVSSVPSPPKPATTSRSKSRRPFRKPDPMLIREYPEFEPELVLIPAGKFLMGSDPRQDPDARKDEQPQHTLYLPDYYIGRMPVTNAQYAAFVHVTGHRAPHHWEHGMPADEIGLHPVTWVIWDDAVEYCRWLAGITGRPYRLPTEAEWEKAARGRKGFIYPWGPDWRTGGANTNEAGIGGTTRVGRYSPRGDSPYGCADMAGNVCEWTSTRWGDHSRGLGFTYRRADDGREDMDFDDWRVVRGGSWLWDRTRTRCAARYGIDLEYDWFGDVGFRVAAAHSSRFRQKCRPARAWRPRLRVLGEHERKRGCLLAELSAGRDGHIERGPGSWVSSLNRGRPV